MVGADGGAMVSRPDGQRRSRSMRLTLVDSRRRRWAD
jgi:hypothetical protein